MKQSNNIREIVIVGGGTAGWMAAAYLSKMVTGAKITLVESEEIGTVGVGEATIPYLKAFHVELGIDENEFMSATNATFKLGIDFVNWGQIGESYIHGFGGIGQDVGNIKFTQYWLRQQQLGRASDLENYAINLTAARSNKFARARTDMPDSPLGKIAHAFHFDAALYAKFLRKYAQAMGVHRIEGTVADATQREDNGFVDEIIFEDGRRVGADLYIDCSGFRGLLIEQVLKTGYEDWSHWLPMDRAWAVPCESAGPLLPYTRATAHDAGWQWRIPLQSRIGNGHVFSSRFTSEEGAAATLMRNLDGKALAEPRLLKFTTGKRKKVWNKNVVTLGLGSGFMEPLESTSIHLVESTLVRLVSLFPDQGFSQVDTDEFNHQADFDYASIRDFLIAHYKITRRNDSEFWNYVRTMDIPDSLQARLDLFASKGRFFKKGTELFSSDSWFAVMYGQGLHPTGYHPLLDGIGDERIDDFFTQLERITRKCAEAMPLHSAYIAGTCPAKPM